VNKLKRGMAAIGLVASLGLVVPSTFGGSVSADITHNPHVHLNNEFTLACDLDGDSKNDTTYVPSHYEKTYTFVSSTEDEKLYHDLNSNTVLKFRDRFDVLRADYIVPDDDDLSFIDDYVEWFDRSDVSSPPEQRKTVRCVNIADSYPYTATADDVLVEPRFVAGVTYDETDYQLYWAVLSAGGKIANGKAQAHHAHKHRGKHGH
jgi:hypothetical protein